jgi:ribosomal protein S18 acetylase RimI-like enzyme
MVAVRRYEPRDLAAVREICILTGYQGGDARGVMTDLDLLPDAFAEPYLVHDPGLAFVVDDGGTAVGYIIGTADTVAFTRWFRDSWLPRIAGKHATPPAEIRSFEDLILTLAHTPERMVRPELAAYPAHLHIDLLPGYQGQGLGRRLMDAFRHEVSARGIDRLHLSMDPANAAARAFYHRLGFEPIHVASDPDGTYLGRSSGGYPSSPDRAL